MSTAGYNSEDSEFTYATHVVGGGQPYPASQDATTPFFFFGFLSSHDIAQGIQREKVGGGRSGTPKVRLPPSYRTMPPGLRY